MSIEGFQFTVSFFFLNVNMRMDKIRNPSYAEICKAVLKLIIVGVDLIYCQF